MKRIVLVMIILLLTTGCININSSSIDEIVDYTLSSKYKMTNKSSSGFKYYLPSNCVSTTLKGNNLLLKDQYYDYYFYVDLVSYYNKIINVYSEDSSAYYSKVLDKSNINGYLNVYKLDEEYYLIDSIYNYGHIEVKVKEKDINLAISNILVVLSSIEYNDDVIKRMMEDDTLISKEEVINIFKKDDSDDHDYLEADNEETYEEELFDPDIIN